MLSRLGRAGLLTRVGLPRTIHGEVSSTREAALNGRLGDMMLRSRANLNGMSITEVFGHGSFVLLGVSFIFQDIMHLRTTALFAGTAMATYDFPIVFSRLFIV